MAALSVLLIRGWIRKLRGDWVFWRDRDEKPIHIAPIRQTAGEIRPVGGYMASIVPRASR